MINLYTNPSGIHLFIHQDFQTLSEPIQLKFHMETSFVSAKSNGPLIDFIFHSPLIIYNPCITIVSVTVSNGALPVSFFACYHTMSHLGVI